MLKHKWSDILLLPGLLLQLAATDVQLRLMAHGRNRGMLFPEPAKDEPSQQPLDVKTQQAIDRLTRLVAAAARLQGPFNFSCLRQALVLRSRLRSLGVTARLVYGVRKDSAAFAAHAWLEAGGKAINSISDMQPFEALE